MSDNRPEIPPYAFDISKPSCWLVVIEELELKRKSGYAEKTIDAIIADAKERNEIGTRKYGTPLQPNNGRNPLVDAYQESLDLLVYLKQAWLECSIGSRADLSEMYCDTMIIVQRLKQRLMVGER